MIIAELICIKLINNEHKNEPKNIVNLKKTLITHNIKKWFETIAKLNIIFTIFSERNKKKMLSDLMKKNNKNLLLKNNIEFLI